MLQLKKSIRVECLRLPFKKALIAAAEMGADGVEINGRTELAPREMTRTAVRHFRKLLADLNLQVASIYFPTRQGYDVTDNLDQRIDGTKAAMKMAYELGCRVVVNKIGRVPKEQDDPRWNTLLQALTDLGVHSQKAGAWLCARTGNEDGETLAQLLESLPDYSLGIDFDPGDFLINGHSASEAMKQLGKHVMSFRARDAVTDLSLGQTIEVQLGRGSVDWANLFGLLEEQNYNGFINVERVGSDYPLIECQQSMEFLTNMFR